MPAVALACLIAAVAPPAIGLAYIELEEVSDADARAVLAELAGELERASGRPVLTVAVPGCAPACAEAVRASARTDDVVLVRLFAGPQHVHAVLERHPALGATAIRANQDLPNQGDDRRYALATAAASLVPEGPVRAAGPEVIVAAPSVRGPSSALPWIPAALAVAAAGAGTVLGLVSASASAELARPGVLDDEDYRSLRGDAAASQAAAIALLASAAALAGLAAWWSLEAD